MFFDVYFVKSTQGFGSNFIYNRKTKESFLTNEEKPFIMNCCFAIVDNILLSIHHLNMCPDSLISA